MSSVPFMVESDWITEYEYKITEHPLNKLKQMVPNSIAIVKQLLLYEKEKHFKLGTSALLLAIMSVLLFH